MFPHMKKVRLLALAGLFLTLWLVAACQQQAYLAETDFANNCWNIRDTLQFEYEMSARENTPTLHLRVHFLEDYTYRNVYFKLIIHTPSGMTTDTLLQIVVVDPQGYWTIERKSGAYTADLTYPLRAYDESGSYRFQLTQFMREEELCQIESAGVWLE